MKINSRINAYYAGLYAKRLFLGLFLVLVLAGIAALMISKSPNPEDIEVTEVVAYMVSFHPREDRFGTSFLIQVELEDGSESAFHSDQIGTYEAGGTVLLRQTKNLKTGKISHSFLQRIKPNPNKSNQAGTLQSNAPV